MIVTVYGNFFFCLANGTALCQTSHHLILICRSRFTLCVSFQFTKLSATEMEPDVRGMVGHRKWSVNASSSSGSCLAVTWVFLLAAFVVWIEQRERSVCPSVRDSNRQVQDGWRRVSICGRDGILCTETSCLALEPYRHVECSVGTATLFRRK